MPLAEIERGSRGHQVRTAQRLVSDALRLRPPLDPDGDFGRLTHAAVERYQRAHGLEIDGIIGRDTWRALGAEANQLPGGPAPQDARAAPRPAPHALAAAAPAAARAPSAHVAAPAPRPAPAPTAAPRRPAAPTPAHSSDPKIHRVEMLVAAQPEAAWMKVALAEYGVHEIAGRRHTARILEYHAATSLHARTDEVPWCASFVNWCLQQVGVRGTGSAAAASFSPWGVPTAQDRFGAIVHLNRARRGHDRATGSSSGNHVAFLVGAGPGYVELLGGNQGRDRVSVSRFPTASYTVRGCRWPG